MRKALYIAVLTGFISFVICLVFSGNVTSEYFPVMFYPLLYAVMGSFLIPSLMNGNNGGRITSGIFMMLQWLRAVLLPSIGSISGYFSSITYNTDSSSAALASWLFLYELIVSFATCYVALRYSKKKESARDQITGIQGRASIYIIYILFAVVLYIVRGKGMYSFFRLSLTGIRASMSEADTGLIISTLIEYGLNLLVVVILYYNYKKFLETNQKQYMWFALIVALVRLCIISSFSEGRLSIVYLFGAFLLLLPQLFVRYKKTITRSVSIIAIAVLGMMTIYKSFSAFLYSSYSAAIANGVSNYNMLSLASTIDIYFYGVRDIASNIYVTKQISIPTGTIFVDLLRNTFGLHYFFKGNANTTVALYNLYIYNGLSASGHLYSSLAYGNTYLTPIFAPITTAFNILFAVWIENKLYRIRNIDTYYIVCIAYIRLAATLFCNFPMAWNYASRSLVLGYVVIGFGSFLNRRKEKYIGRSVTSK